MFVKGKSGNPGGRKKDHDVRALARTHTAEAIERLVDWMRSDNPKASPAACVALLNRGWGQPMQPLSGPDGEALVLNLKL